MHQNMTAINRRISLDCLVFYKGGIAINYEVEIWFKGVDDPVYCTATEEELGTLSEYIGQKCVLGFSDDWGGTITVYLKDAYAYNSKKIAVQEDDKSISDDEIKHYIL